MQSLSFFFYGGQHVISLTEEQIRKVTSLFDLLKELKEEKKTVSGIVYALLMVADSFHRVDDEKSKNNNISNGEKIAQSFRKLVAEQFREHKEVAHSKLGENV
ncbi:hypothetical protein [Dyadobacter pollutisoli]|uniref:Uncharacterized protein n=1 Tax=Dyadobacter pollutisoli TaxID=2910158 RepID=A0A9E8NAQ0_9BACT|nr:hypothetical protein [Dyadobacter pollutisoli]WAC13144.1 hypothetical protein ON006_04100 [Dyadobacter pollutisoli]